MKITIIIALVFFVCALLYFTGKKSAYSEIVIDADISEVWEVLTDMENYTNWNPVMSLKQGNFQEGEKVVYNFVQDAENTYDVPVKVLKIETEKLINQKGGYPFILTYNHKYILENLGEQTKVIIDEEYRGIGVNFWNPQKVENAYQRINEALKVEMEK